MLSSSSVMVVSNYDNGRLSDASLTDSEDMFISIENENGAEFFAIDPPRAVLNKDSSSSLKEKQISVDPISLQGPGPGPTIRQASFRLVSSTTNNNNNNKNGSTLIAQAPLRPPAKLKFVSASACSSPQSGSNKYKYDDDHHQQQSKLLLSRMPSTRMMDESQYAGSRESDSRRTKSLGEGRFSTATDDFDLWLEKPNKSRPSNKFSKPPLGPPTSRSGYHDQMRKTKSRDRGHSNNNYPLDHENEERFKCGKLCIFLPRAGKGKPVRSISTASTATTNDSILSQGPTAISRRVSLEKFECGFWSDNDNGGDQPNLFFDLPIELLRCSVSDMQSPVTAAFVFDNDDDDNKQTIINTDGSKFQDSTSSSSSPMLQARADLDAFLEAQGS